MRFVINPNHAESYPHQRRIRWFIVIVAMMISLQTARLFSDIGRPFIGTLAFYNPYLDGWTIDPFTPNGWTPLLSEFSGAKLEWIDGHPYHERQAAARYQAALDAGRTSVDLTVWHGDGRGHQTYTAPIQHFTLSHAVDIWASRFLLAMGLLILAWECYRAGAAGWHCRVMAVAAGWAAFHSGIDRPSLYWYEDTVAAFLSLLLLIVPAFSASSMLMFALIFPDGQALKKWWVWAAIWGFRLWVMSAGIAHLIATLSTYWTGDPRPFLAFDDYGYRNISLAISLSTVILIVRPFYIYWRQPRWRRRMTIVLLGALAFAPFLIWMGIERLNGTLLDIASTGYEQRYLMLLIPFSLTYLILRYQAFQSSSPLLLSVPVIALSGVFANLFSHALRPLFPPPAVWDVPLFAVIFITIALVVWGGLMHSYLRNAMLWLLNYNSVGYDEIRTFNTAFAQAHPLQTSLSPYHLAEGLAGALNLGYAAIWVLNDRQNGLILEGEYAAETITDADIAEIDFAVWSLGEQQTEALPPIVYAKHHRLPAPFPQLLTGAAEVALPLMQQGALIGVVTFGHRYDNDIFDIHEVKAIEVMLNWLALYLIDQRRIRLLSEAEAEQEWIRQAARQTQVRLIHDMLNGPLRVISQTIEGRLNQKFDPFLHQLLGHTQSVQQSLRSFQRIVASTGTRTELGLELQKLCELTGDSTVRYEGVMTLRHPISSQLYQEVFMTVNELITNARKHAHASHIIVSIADTGQKSFTVSVTDDGIGSTIEQRQAAEHRGQLGVASLKERFEVWDVTVDYQSEIGGGTHVRLNIPYPL